MHNTISGQYKWVITLAAIVIGMVGCSKMNDIQKKYVGNGEITYVAKPDSLSAISGHKRIELSWLLLSDPKISGYKVYWNNRKDSVENTVVRTSGIDTIKILLNDMAEGTYSFEAYTYDKEGNTSIIATVTGKVYGDIYQNTLLTRAYRGFTRTGDDIQILWMDADAQMVDGSLHYVDKLGQTHTLDVPISTDTTTLKDFPIGGGFDITSAFLPEPDALDTFYANASGKIPLDTVLWSGYNNVFGHLGALAGQAPSGQVSWYANTGGDEFLLPTTAVTGWTIFDIVFSYGNYLMGREARTGKLYRYLVDAAGKFGLTHWQVGDPVWNAYDLIFGNGNYIFGRDSEAVIWRYPMDEDGNLGVSAAITGSYAQYDQIVACGHFLMARTIDGKLWSIAVADDGTAGEPVQQGMGWNAFDLLSTYGDDLLARKPDGSLWLYPVEPSGSLGSPKQIVISSEKL